QPIASEVLFAERRRTAKGRFPGSILLESDQKGGEMPALRGGARMQKKVTVVGGGFVGSTTAQRIHDAGLADVVLTDILEGVPAGKALDMAESGPILGSDALVAGISTASGDYKETANSDIIVI